MGDSRRCDDDSFDVVSRQERLGVRLERTRSVTGLQQGAPVLGIDSRCHEVSATDGVAQQGGMEPADPRSEEHTSELQSRQYLVCRLLLEKKNLSYFLHYLVPRPL